MGDLWPMRFLHYHNNSFDFDGKRKSILFHENNLSECCDDFVSTWKNDPRTYISPVVSTMASGSNLMGQYTYRYLQVSPQVSIPIDTYEPGDLVIRMRINTNGEAIEARAVRPNFYNTRATDTVVGYWENMSKGFNYLGVALNAESIGLGIWKDSNQGWEETCGQNTVAAIAGIAGGFAGEKIGAAVGAWVGNSICPIVGAVAGSIIGGFLAGFATTYLFEPCKTFLKEYFIPN